MRCFTDVDARSIIKDLLDAGYANHQAAAENAGLKAAERKTDQAIRRAWKEMTGQKLVGDPVDAIYGENRSI